MFTKTETTIKVTAIATSSSGRTFTPSVSSSKNLNRPALAAGIGAESFFFFRIPNSVSLSEFYSTSL